MVKVSELIRLFKEQSCENKIQYDYFKTECPDGDCFYSITISYYTNKWSIEHMVTNDVEIVLDSNKEIMGIEFESGGDRVSPTKAWKRLCKALAEEETFEFDVNRKKEKNEL